MKQIKGDRKELSQDFNSFSHFFHIISILTHSNEGIHKTFLYNKLFHSKMRNFLGNQNTFQISFLKILE